MNQLSSEPLLNDIEPSCESDITYHSRPIHVFIRVYSQAHLYCITKKKKNTLPECRSYRMFKQKVSLQSIYE